MNRQEPAPLYQKLIAAPFVIFTIPFILIGGLILIILEPFFCDV